MHLNVTIKNVSWPHFSWPTLYMTALMLGPQRQNHDLQLVTLQPYLALILWPCLNMQNKITVNYLIINYLTANKTN